MWLRVLKYTVHDTQKFRVLKVKLYSCSPAIQLTTTKTTTECVVNGGSKINKTFLALSCNLANSFRVL